ncbi:type IV secretion system protein VirB5 [Maridesulfovibrio ferrireducens]|uniref:Type IV secretion system protein VirB5 n=1 Tax=Maridesulfovibrio ferrireducens TaxID=246191 RepID=A0A1G9EN99_9BACT|nr:type IV secretion system protein [Maridesulfovibrio ferrireducens]SDK77568.1 type IV secretion system protein VirB5 [Maridesulfovibrio ferrireducens]
MSDNNAESPYIAAKEEWFERYGSYIKSRNQWRTAALGLIAISILCLTGNIIQITQNKVIPYVVEVDKLGHSVAVKRADSTVNVSDRIIQAEIANLIVNWRTVTADIGLQKKMVTKMSSFVTGAARGATRSWYEANNPYERGQKTLVEVDIKGIPLPVSSESWRIEWLETIRNHSGVAMSSTKYEATLKVRISSPTTDSQIIRNPAGVYITELSWAKLLEQ